MKKDPTSQSGRLIELQIVFFFLIMGVLLSVGLHSALKGFGLAAVGLVGFFGGLMALAYVVSRGMELFDTPWGRRLKPAGAALLGAAAAAAAGGFAAIFLAPAVSATPEGRLRTMRLMAVLPALVAGAAAYRAARRSQR